MTKEVMDHSVMFEEFSLNPYPAVKQADIVLLCSRNEAFGRVIVEGMLLKKPVIGTNSGGVPEVIKDEINGLLYDPGNSSMLADKIEYLINCPEKQKELGKNGYIFVKNNLSADRYGGEIYRRLLDIKDVPSPQASPLLAYLVMLMDQVIHSEKLQLEKLRKQVVDSDSQIQMLEQLVSDRDSKIQMLEQLASGRDSQVKELEQLVSDCKSQIQILELQTAEMRQSILYQLAEKFQGRFVDHFFPVNTKRREVYDRGMQSGRVVVNNRLNCQKIENYKNNKLKEGINETKGEGNIQNIEVKDLEIDTSISNKLNVI